MSVRILIIDDSADDRTLIRRALGGVAECDECGSLAEAREVLTDEAFRPDAILLDVSLPDGDGDRGESLSAVRELSRIAPVIICTGMSLEDCPELSVQARAAGAANMTTKNLILHDPTNLIRQIDWAITPPVIPVLPEPGQRHDALRLRALQSMERSYNPNDMAAMVATMLERQEQMHRDNKTAVEKNAEVLEQILEQAKKTNGRVTNLEAWRETEKARKEATTDSLKTGAKVGAALMVAFTWFFGAQLKERLALDPGTVRRILAEEMAQQAIKVTKPPAP